MQDSHTHGFSHTRSLLVDEKTIRIRIETTKSDTKVYKWNLRRMFHMWTDGPQDHRLSHGNVAMTTINAQSRTMTKKQEARHRNKYQKGVKEECAFRKKLKTMNVVQVLSIIHELKHAFYLIMEHHIISYFARRQT